MPCPVEELRHVSVFSLLDDDELAVLASQVEVREYVAKQRIYKIGDVSEHAYVMLEGAVRVVLLDGDGQEVTFSEPRRGDVFGFASMLDHSAHQTSADAVEPSRCIEIDRVDLTELIEKKPMAGLDMLTVLARDIHQAQHIVRTRTAKSPNEILDEEETAGARIADQVAAFGGSWTFILLFIGTMTGYVVLSLALVATRGKSWDPYPFILLNLFLSMLAAIQAPVIMMSQNRQDKKDRVRSELDFEVNRRSESEIKDLGRRLKFLADKLDDIGEGLRSDRKVDVS